MKLRNLIMTGVLTITLFGALPTISHADNVQQGIVKMVDDLTDNKKPKQFKSAVKHSDAPALIGGCTPADKMKDKKSSDYKRLVALEDSLNYATWKSYKPKQLKVSKKEYKEIEKYLKNTADNSANILEGKKGVRVNKLNSKLEKTMYKKLAVGKIAIIDPQRFKRDSSNSEYITIRGYVRDYISMERNELIDKGLTGAEAGALLSGEEVLTQSIEGNFNQAWKFQKTLREELKSLLDM